MLSFRYDLRRPDWSPAPAAALYATAVEQARFVDAHGLGTLTLSEHHASDDGYLPSPVVLGSAFAGVTERSLLVLGAVVAPLYDPVRLAEDLAVLDLVAGGRLMVVLGLGYRREEYDLHGRPWAGRGDRFDRIIEVLLRAWTGEPFEWEGRTVRVLPRPATEPHPLLFVGGSSTNAARRAARHGLNFLPTVGDAALEAAYTQECERLGTPPGICVLPPGGPACVHVAEDPDKGWAEVGPHLLHDARTYDAWQPAGQRTKVTGGATGSVDELRADGRYRVVTPDECVELVARFGTVVAHPLVGGLPPELSWPSLQLIADRVAPRLGGAAT